MSIPGDLGWDSPVGPWAGFDPRESLGRECDPNGIL